MHAAVLLGMLPFNVIAIATDVEPAVVPPGYALQYYDDCGVRGRQPHVPSQAAHTFSSAQVEGDDRARSVTYGVPHFEVVYDGLKDGVPYVLAITYASERGNPRVQSLASGSVVLHGPLTLPDGRAQRYVFSVLPEAVAQGRLTLFFRCESGHNAVASVVELWAPLPAKSELHLTLTPHITGVLSGQAGDIAYAPVAGAFVSVKNTVSGECVETQTGTDGAFSLDVSAQAAQARSGSFDITARYESMEATASATFDELRFDEPVIRPIPSRVAGIRDMEVLLDGVWEIWPRPQDSPSDPPEQDHDARDFSIPGQWLQQGFDFPRGREVCLARNFEVPAEWAGKRVILRFDAVHGGATYWLNGQRLGYSENLFTPIEFDATDAVRTGRENRLVLSMKVDTPSERASFSSDYAFHSLGGIDRSVRLFALPAVHATDLSWTTTFDAAYRDAVLSLHVVIENATGQPAPGVVCRVALREPSGRRAIAEQEQCVGDLEAGPRPFEMNLPVPEPRQWNAETPCLYALSVELRKDGRLLERIERRVGFRTVAARDGRLLVNGRSVKLAGANRHETDPLTGRAATARHAEQDARLFKDANFNYVRTSHYPPTSEFLDACDEAGLYVECEAPFCWTRGGRGEDEPALAGRFLTPVAAMLRAHRNHPSIILWSIANESGNGPDGKNELPANFALAMDYCHRNDPSRLVLFNNEWARDGGRGDIAVLHYPGWPPENSEWIKEDKRPVLLDEYFPPQTFTFAETLKRNPGLDVVNWSGGENRAESFWDHLWRSPNVIGGAIWAGIDEEFHLPGGKTVGYGPWGFIDGWRRPKSLWWDAKLIFSPVHIPVRRIDWTPGRDVVEIPVVNRYAFTDLNELKIAWEVGGKRGTCRMDLPPNSEGRLRLKLPRSTREGDILALRFYGRQGGCGIIPHQQNRMVAAHGVRLGKAKPPIVPTPSAGCPQWKDNGKAVEVIGKDFAIEIDRSSLRITGNTALEAFPRLFLTRLEEKNVFNPNGAAYAELPDPATRTGTEIGATPCAGYLSIAATDAYAGYEGSVELRIDAAGQCRVAFDYAYTGEAFTVGELGVRFALDAQCDAIEWRREAEWDVLPDDHIGRAAGRASARGGNEIDADAACPDGPWHLDTNEFGTRDFRATKYSVLETSVRARDGRGLRIDSDGSADVRACLAGNSLALHVLQSEERGEKALPWPLGPAPRQLKPGARIAGEFFVRLLPGRNGETTNEH